MRGISTVTPKVPERSSPDTLTHKQEECYNIAIFLLDPKNIPLAANRIQTQVRQIIQMPTQPEKRGYTDTQEYVMNLLDSASQRTFERASKKNNPIDRIPVDHLPVGEQILLAWHFQTFGIRDGSNLKSHDEDGPLFDHGETRSTYTERHPKHEIMDKVIRSIAEQKEIPHK